MSATTPYFVHKILTAYNYFILVYEAYNILSNINVRNNNKLHGRYYSRFQNYQH